MGMDPAVLAKLITESGVKFASNSMSYIFECPKCKGAKKLYIRKADGRFVCWVCRKTQGFEGRAEFALAELLNRPVRELSARLYGREGVQAKLFIDIVLEDFFDSEEVAQEEVTPTVFWPLDYHELDSPKAKRGVEYLESRGIPLEVARQYGIRYCPVKRRVVFPLESQGNLFGWQERLVIPDTYVVDNEVYRGAKVLSSTKLPRDREVMFADRLNGHSHAVLCEGPVDSIKAHLCGGNVCTMGKAVTRSQMNRLLYAGVKKLYLALDPDAATEMGRLAREWRDDMEIYQIVVPARADGKKADLGAMSFEEVYEAFRGAKRIAAGHVFGYLESFYGKSTS